MAMLEQEFQVLTAIEQGKVIGGGSGSGGDYGSGGGYGSGGPGDGSEVVDWLLGPLTSGGHLDISGLSQIQEGNLHDALDQIAATPDGKKLLDDIWASGRNFGVTNVKPTNFYATYESQNQGGFDGIFNFGNIVDNMNIGMHVKAASHELFHAYEDINGISMNTTNAELDAYMFDALVMKEFGESDYANITMNDGDINTTADQGFGSAWNNFLNNGNYSMDNYNQLNINFGTGSTVGSAYNGGSWTSTEPTDETGTILGFISGPDPELMPPDL